MNKRQSKKELDELLTQLTEDEVEENIESSLTPAEKLVPEDFSEQADNFCERRATHPAHYAQALEARPLRQVS